jgi:Glycosyl hydrolase family 49 N-terminal Ig-like domain/Glycosyl hydrolase family 49/Beta solenoid repeat from Dextranase/Isopullulanase beta-solenoid repeat
MMSFAFTLLFLLLLQRLTLGALTSNSTSLLTWWHDTGVVNANSTIADDSVRQSGLYSVQVSVDSSSTYYYDSFVYQVIPANGMSDELQYASNTDETQSWSSFLTLTDVIVRVTRSDDAVLNANNNSVTIRPTNLRNNLTILYDTSDPSSVYITIPYNENGYRFSVEFEDDLVAAVSGAGPEPQNSLLIFASPMEDSSLVPVPDSDTFIATPGRVYDTNVTSASTVIFYPGVYWFTGTDHILLSDTVSWVYFAPGAYVKGAVQFQCTASEVKVTGHGVLSGEQYVWYADPLAGYQTPTSSNNNGLRMWAGNNTDTQTFILNGPTMAAPPFNSMDWSGNLDGITVYATDYKQVGAFYGQTDGLEMYPGSVIQDVFYHCNDDTIKAYYSNVVAQRIVVWKLDVAPVIQFGWAPLERTNVTIDGVDVIHQSYDSALNNPGLIGSDNNYEFAPSGLSSDRNTANTNLTTSNMTFSNIRAEGLSACLFRIYPLQNLNGIYITDVWIEQFQIASLNTTGSWLEAFYDMNNGDLVEISDFVISGFKVGNVTISDASLAHSVGQIYPDSQYVSSVTYDS